ncbi:telomere-associated protein RIF1 [Genypterus blacodes]|uniref:telomere-associated protein RIF1 n=1 Tax=Genypterus blacodes TaxID=154954 RepID=UPI003F75F9CC
MVETTGTLSSSGFLSLLETLEDSASGQSEQTDACLTIANRLSGEEGRQFLPEVQMHFSRLGQTLLTHIPSPNAELSQAALQALGFCVYHSQVVSKVPEDIVFNILSTLCSVVVNATDKNTSTRALWVISKQNFPTNVVGKKASSILTALESVWSRKDIQSVVMEHEALNVIIRMLEQVPTQMGHGVVRWARLVIPLVVHSASKVRLRAAAAVEMGLPLLLEKQPEVAAVIEPIMSSKLIPELQKLFMSKNETNVLKLWPLFVKLLGKLLHKGGPFINSLLHLEELGFRSSSPTIKKIAFIAWKSLIDNFAVKPEILCNGKRLKLLMQPLTSIHVRTEALLLTKVEVWWYLAVRLGPNLASNFEQVSLPLLQCTFGSDISALPATPSRGATQSGTTVLNSPAITTRMSLNSSVQADSSFLSIQLLGLEMLLHYFLGPEIVATAAKTKLVLSLEPLTHPCLSGTSSFIKHAPVLILNIKDGFIAFGKDAPDSLLALIWMSLVSFVGSTIESVGTKKDCHGCEALTLMLQALQSIVISETLSADKVLGLIETTVKGIPTRVLGSASYQVGKMDVLNGTPALFLITLFFDSSMLATYVKDERFFQCLHTLVGCGLSGPTSPLAFGEAVFGAIRRSAGTLHNKEQLWRMWNVIVNPLIDTVMQSNEVNQGDALEHNFSAVHSALFFPITHLLRGTPLQQVSQKSMLSTWSKLYKVFARCSALVVTADENICCEELCAKMAVVIDREELMAPSTLKAFASILQVMVECVDFSPFKSQFQQKHKSPHTPHNWMRKKNKALGNLSTFQSLLIDSLEVYLAVEETESPCEATGLALISVLSTLFTNLALSTAVKEALASLIQPLALLYKQGANETPKFSSLLLTKLEKLLPDILGCLQTRSSLACSDELLALLSPLLCVLFTHKSKQHRILVTQFWNDTFAHSVSLTYPDDLIPILSQVKQNTPIILPGFVGLRVSEDLSQQYSESSQLETVISGIQITQAVKRDSLLDKVVEQKDERSKDTSRPVSIKLDFASPKPRREVLEEEASIDFVFIPPETKERVLTEHQKEVKRTKRVDIPAMYNNLDASLDSTVFTQYTQSQEDTMDQLPTGKANGLTKEAPGKALLEDIENGEILTKKTQNCVNENAAETLTKDTVNSKQEEMLSKSDVEMEDTRSDADVDMEGNDLISGTPQKPISRRQSFLTLEKYAEGKPATPSKVFTGLSSSQERKTKTTPTKALTTEPQVFPSSEAEEMTQCSVDNASESSQLPGVDSEKKIEPEMSQTETPNEETEDEDVIPDTQTDIEGNDSTSDMQGEESQENMDDSASSLTLNTSSEPRRSGRRRSKPLLPGDDPKEPAEKVVHLKKRRHGDLPNSDRHLQDGPCTRSKQAAEEDLGRHRLRTRVHVDKSESGQTSSRAKSQGRINHYSSPKELLEKPELKRRSLRKEEGSQNDSQSDTLTHSHGKRNRLSKSILQPEKEGRWKKKGFPMKENDESSQNIQNTLPDITEPPSGKDKTMNHLLDSTKVKLPGETNMDMVEPTLKESQTVSLPQMDDQAQSFVELKNCAKDEVEQSQIDSQILTPPQNACQSPGFEQVAQDISDKNEPSQKNSQRPSPSGISCQSLMATTPQTDQALFEQTKNEMDETEPSQKDSQILTLTDDSRTITNNLINDMGKLIKETHNKTDVIDDDLSQETRTATTPSASDSQFRRRSRRSKSSSEAVESQDGSESKDLAARPLRSNSQETPSPLSQTEDRPGGRITRNKVQEEQLRSTPTSTIESSQSLEKAPSAEFAQGRSRFSRRRSSQASSNVESSKPLESNVIEAIGKDNSQSPQTIDVQSTHFGSPLKTEQMSLIDEITVSEPSEVAGNSIEQSKQQTLLEVDSDAIIESEPTALRNSESANSELVRETEQGQMHSKTELDIDDAYLQERDTAVLQAPETIESDQIGAETIQEKPLCDVCVSSSVENSIPCNCVPKEPCNVPLLPDPSGPSVNTMLPSSDTAQNLSLLVSESSEKNDKVVDQTGEMVTKELKNDSDSDCQEHPNEVDEAEDIHCTSSVQIQSQCSNAIDELSKEEHFIKESKSRIQDPKTNGVESDAQEHNENIVPSLDGKEENNTCDVECQDGEQNQLHNPSRDVVNEQADVGPQCDPSESTSKDVFQTSPAKLKDLETVTGLDVSHSPSSARPRGTWSSSASPSTSILKKGQKRPLMEDTPSPCLKSRRVSFANPIQHQELADDIDRRSPALRTSSPRRSKTSIPQPKHVTTPTKSLLFLSPRSLHTVGSKSSKKCLISEMSRASCPVPKDCIYPSLVGCTTPVEAVLPQISNVWSRGLGQLVRARNIKTVGDLSSLPPGEIKSLPIRSPKIFNVKKALKTYEQQHKGQVGDELKSFDEMERMASELEDTSAPKNQDEVDKSLGEPLATELVDEPGQAEGRMEKDTARCQTADGGLLLEFEALASRMTPLELSRCSPQQLVKLHEQLGGVMRLVVANLQSRLCQAEDKP